MRRQGDNQLVVAAAGAMRDQDLDTFVKTGGAWLFSERLLYVDWVDERALS
jgi:hypothetical protein